MQRLKHYFKFLINFYPAFSASPCAWRHKQKHCWINLHFAFLPFIVVLLPAFACFGSLDNFLCDVEHNRFFLDIKLGEGMVPVVLLRKLSDTICIYFARTLSEFVHEFYISRYYNENNYFHCIFFPFPKYH